MFAELVNIEHLMQASPLAQQVKGDDYIVRRLSRLLDNSAPLRVVTSLHARLCALRVAHSQALGRELQWMQKIEVRHQRSSFLLLV